MALAVAENKPWSSIIADRRSEVLRPLLMVTLIAAGTEVVLLRLISRIGVHIPAMSWARDSYTAAVTVGNRTFPVATIFAAALLAVLALSIARRRLFVACAALTVLGYQVWLLLTPDRPAAVAIHELALAGGLLAVAVAMLREQPAKGMVAFVGLVAVAEFAGQAQHASAILTADGGRALPLAVTSAGEVLLLVALLFLPLLLAPTTWHLSAFMGGVAAAILVAGAIAGNESTARILAIWTFGLSMPAPALLYAIAAGMLTATAIALWQAGRTAQAAGLVLVALGGYVPPSSYQANLLLAGMLLIAFPWVLGDTRGEPRRAMA
jgi:hypothetical protein